MTVKRVVEARAKPPKKEKCDRMVATTYSDMEKEAWFELARDWKALTTELNEPLAIAPLPPSLT